MMLAANMFVGPEIDWFKISPLLVMLGGVLLLILAGSLTPQWKKGAYGIVGALTAAGAAVLTALLWRDLGDGAPSSLLANAVTFSKFTLFATFSIASRNPACHFGYVRFLGS
jgi:NADH-quinone oxidoreductase subunit N